MGATQSIQKINYEDVQTACNSNEYVIISTLPTTQQDCLIRNTIPCSSEESILNNLMTGNKSARIIVYGVNCNDETIQRKYHYLLKCGFSSVYLYVGGLFEWLCLADIYGDDLFPVTNKELDILRYKPASCLSSGLLTASPHGH